MIAVRGSGSSWPHCIGPWTADATCSKGQVVRRGGGGGGGEGRGLAPMCGGPVKLFLVHVP